MLQASRYQPVDDRDGLDAGPAASGAEDEIDRRVRARIRLGRRRLGIAPGVLDLMIGARDGTVERLEAGTARTTAAHLFRLAGLYGVDVGWFYAETAEPDEPAADLPMAEPVDAYEARRFLLAYRRLSSPDLRVQVRALVTAIAEARSSFASPAAAGLPVSADEAQGLPAES